MKARLRMLPSELGSAVCRSRCYRYAQSQRSASGQTLIQQFQLLREVTLLGVTYGSSARSARRLIDGPPIDHRPQHLRLQNLGRRHLGQIAVQHNKVGYVPRNQFALEAFGKLRVSRALGVREEHLADGQLVLRKVTLCPRLVAARDPGIDSAKGVMGSTG